MRKPLLSLVALAALALGPAPARAQATADAGHAPHMLDDAIFAHAVLNQLEGRFGNGSSFRWSGEGWVGTDENRLLLRSEGRVSDGQVDDGIQELLYSRAVSTYFNAQVGARYDLDSLPGRGWGAIGVEGLAPQFFRVAATGYVSGGGHLAAKLEGSIDFLITQRLILQPQIELNFYTRDDPVRHVGAGLSELDAGLRLRYEITRQFAPYIGLTYLGQYGATARYVRDAGGEPQQLRFTAGVRLWF